MAIVGAGPIGLAALLTAQFYAPAEIVMIDLDDNRLHVARRFRATHSINSADGKAAERVKALTGGRGVDTITTRLVDTVTTPMLLKTVQSGRIDPKLLITHRFRLSQILEAYDTFGRAADTRALKVIIEA